MVLSFVAGTDPQMNGIGKLKKVSICSKFYAIRRVVASLDFIPAGS